MFTNHQVTWIRPASLAHLLDIKAELPHAKLVVGNTELAIEHKLKSMQYPLFVYIARIPELLEIRETPKGVTVGGSVTLSDLGDHMRDMVARFPEHKVCITSFLPMLLLSAS